MWDIASRIFLILGLPLSLLFAWFFKLAPEGLKLEKYVDKGKSIATQTSRKLDLIIITMMAIVLMSIVADKFISNSVTLIETVPADPP